jgi:hypothetical protein
MAKKRKLNNLNIRSLVWRYEIFTADVDIAGKKDSGYKIQVMYILVIDCKQKCHRWWRWYQYGRRQHCLK